MLHVAFIHVLSFILLVSCCDGSSLLYVRPDDYTLCPDHGEYCLTLSEYAHNLPHYLGPNTTLAFLPGHHILDTAFNVNGNVSSALAFRACDPARVTQVTCIKNATFCFGYMESVIFADLDIVCFNSKSFTSEINTDSVTSLLVQSCNLSITLALYNTGMVSTGSKFIHSSGWGFLFLVNASFNNCSFANNSGILYVLGSSITTSGIVSFENNRGVTGFVLLAELSNVSFSGSTRIANNTGGTPLLVTSGSQLLLDGETVFENNGPYGGAIAASSSSLNFTGNTRFFNNSGPNGGAITASSGSSLNFTGNTTFANNHAKSGGAVYAVFSFLCFSVNSTTVFANNTATNGGGGAISLESSSKLIFLGSHPNPKTVRFQGNVADRGGALYVQDSNPLTYCLVQEFNAYDDLALEDCFYEVPSGYTCPHVCPKIMHFESNRANIAGHGLYGGAIDRCTHPNYPISFDEIVSIPDDPMEISSDPYIVCACNDTGPNCGQPLISRKVPPGGSINVSVVALGQRHGPAPATILAIPDSPIQIGELEGAYLINNTCANLSYTIFGAPGNGTLLLYAEGSCQTLGINLTIVVEVGKCPPGFEASKGNGICECNDRLQKYTDACNITDQTITRDGAFWVGYDQDLDDVILYPNCPFDYCVTRPVSFVLEDYNAQCRYNRAGLLCGGCGEGLSLHLGSSRCGKCSNSHLGLLVFFAVAGVLLVVFLLTFNLTVAVGTINGLIFYANIVGSNQAILFPKESTAYLDVLKIFIAWINLDFGIESCFYNGMDAYHRAWLQYAFPTYIWSLIVLVFVVSHFSQRASRILGSNPVVVLATLMLLSYAKVLHNIIEVFHSAALEYPHGHSKWVWIYDGNVLYFGGKHLVLFVFSVLVLIFLFIPYTMLLLTSQWLQIKSHWKILSWLNKPQLRAFLDAYHAPYKPRHRYWTGLLLLVRFAILLMSALNTDSNPAVNLLVVFIFVQVVLLWQLGNGGVYKNWCLDILDSFFLLIIIFLVLVTYYVNYEPSSSQFILNSGSQEAGTAILVTVSLVVFVGIVGYHGYLRVRTTATWKTGMQKITRPNDLQEVPHISAAEEDSGLLPVQAPTRSYVAIPELNVVLNKD